MKTKVKAYFSLALLLGLLCAAGYSLSHISGNAEYVAAAGQQGQSMTATWNLLRTRFPGGWRR